MGDIRHKYLLYKHLMLLFLLQSSPFALGGPNANPSLSSLPDHRSSERSSSNITTGDIGRYTAEEQLLIDDIQDRIETIDQAGLYVLLDHIKKNQAEKLGVLPPLSPIDILGNPDAYRGTISHFNVFVDPEIKTAPLGRPHREPIHYINAQIKTSDKLRIPAIILLPEHVSQSIVDPMAVTGYFYMILRAETEMPDPQTGRKYLDYIVLAATELKPQIVTPSINRHNKKLAIMSLALIVTVSLWIALRFRIKNKYKH
ncbi:MAG: hypothetical protein K9M57_04490 [Phycisphaerae bacterium]|nr:hypothetical protein [Phycisphaerae bacterium]